MPRFQGRFVSGRSTPPAIRLREIEVQIRAILTDYPDLARQYSNHCSIPRPRRGGSEIRQWRRAKLLN